MTQTKGQQAVTRLLPLSKIRTNTGQIKGLPRNPRLIRDRRFEQLKKSIEDFPEMLELREIVVFPYKQIFVCIGGNMRFLACKDLNHQEIPCKVLPANFPVERLAEFAIKDNVGYGSDDLDILANEWTDFPLIDWGAEIPDLSDINLDEFFVDDPKEPDEESFSIVLNYSTESDCNAVKSALLRRGETYEAALHKLLKL